MAVWFTSDLHLGHRLVANLRGFESAADHDAAIVNAWDRMVRKDDDVWVLGDLCASAPHHALDLLASMQGRKHLVSGNHDRCHPMHRDAHNWQRRYLEVFASVQPFARRKVGGQDVLLSHFPYERDREEPRYMQYRLRDHGGWLLHGHLHTEDRGVGREIHVGVDAWGLAPVRLEDVTALMEARAAA
jgi:calcineurin-like phosphoesterase family protein